MNVTIMWGVKKLDLSVDVSKPIGDFMELLQKETGVPVPRQKLMMRRKNLKPEETWESVGLKDKDKLMLIGTAEIAPEVQSLPITEEPAEEDDGKKLPQTTFIGLKNFGNTCYLNSILQVLRYLPGLTEKVINHPSENPVVKSMATFFQNYPAQLPIIVTSLRNSVPLFNEKDPQSGSFRQQDASEAWNYILDILKREVGQDIAQLFQITYRIKLIGTDKSLPDNVENDDRLRCVIDGETKNLEQGIILENQVERGENGNIQIFLEKKEIIKLPKYLLIQMMRFTYRNDEQLTAKIVKRVANPQRLDVSPWLSPDLKESIMANRETAESKNAGYYTLKAIITHKGRRADSGHYVAHVKVQDQWFRYDDEKVSELEDEDIERLSGSADWHCSFLLLYEAQ